MDMKKDIGEGKLCSFYPPKKYSHFVLACVKKTGATSVIYELSQNKGARAVDRL